MTEQELGELVLTALSRAIGGDVDGAARAVCEIGEKSGPQQSEVYGACCGFAEAARQSLVKLYGDRAPDRSKGERWAMLQLQRRLKPDAADLFAMRFIVAYANDDQPTALALFSAALRATDEEYVASVASLLATTASLAKTGAGR
jgi:hypothetical protein